MNSLAKWMCACVAVLNVYDVAQQFQLNASTLRSGVHQKSPQECQKLMMSKCYYCYCSVSGRR